MRSDLGSLPGEIEQIEQKALAGPNPSVTQPSAPTVW
jgi:hypothetical protein